MTLGFVFLLYGLGKFLGGIFAFAEGMQKDFSSTWLPARMVYVLGLTLPFLELLFGALLILGLLRTLAISCGGVLIIILTAGLAISGNPGGVAHNLIYSLVVFFLLSHIEDDRLSLDRLRRQSGVTVDMK